MYYVVSFRFALLTPVDSEKQDTSFSVLSDGTVSQAFIYAALQQEDNPQSPLCESRVIARKLMVLDFVLDEPERDWFVTEQEKLHLSAECLHVRPHALPRRTYDSILGSSDPTVRYFIHKLPIFLTNESARVHFVCLVTDPGATDCRAVPQGPPCASISPFFVDAGGHPTRTHLH